MILPMNPLLQTDVYKMGHLEQYCPGTAKVYSYLIARSGKTFNRTVFFGLQYVLERYLSQPLTPEMGEEFLSVRSRILGMENTPDVEQKIRALCKHGRWPLRVKAVPEGTVMPVRNVLMTITNTLPEFYWCVGFVESLLLKVWYPTTVASCCFQYRLAVERAWARTVDGVAGLEFAVHDFGYRGDSSEEGAAISGVAHLTSFYGSDTVPALRCAEQYYGTAPGELVMASVPATEHSVMCSYGRDDELGAFRRMLDLYPTGIVSIVSDTFDVYRVLTEFAQELRPRIMCRDGKVVFRPDSGDPVKIICGDWDAEEGSPQWLGAIRLLDRMFGSTVNSKGFRVLDPHVGLIYGDGMYMARYETALSKLHAMGYAASNLIIGVGGILRNHSRDTLGFAIKATYVEVDGQPREIEKDPVTDPGKKSHKGLLALRKTAGEWQTLDRVDEAAEVGGELRTVYYDGTMLNRRTLADIRSRVAEAATMEAAR